MNLTNDKELIGILTVDWGNIFILFAIGNGAEIRPQILVNKSPVYLQLAYGNNG